MTGSLVREPDGATQLYWSDKLWNDPPTALRHSPQEFRRVPYDVTLPISIVAEGSKLAPGEWLRYHDV